MSIVPDWTIPYGSENYTGPYLSDAKLQSSVEFGTAEPKSKLDALSRLHDSAYAKFDDQGHRTAADSLYNENAQKLMGLFPELAGTAVLYGNQVSRSASNLASGVTYGLPGLIYGAVKNMFSLNDQLINGDKYRKEVLAYYNTDPMKDLYQSSKYMPTATKAQNEQFVKNKFGNVTPIGFSPPVYQELEDISPRSYNTFMLSKSGPVNSDVIDLGGGAVYMPTQNSVECEAYDPYNSNGSYGWTGTMKYRRKKRNKVYIC